MDVADGLESIDRRKHVARLDHDHEVDQILRCQSRNRGGADVLDRDGYLADDGACTITKPLELERPLGLVVDDDDRLRHVWAIVLR